MGDTNELEEVTPLCHCGATDLLYTNNWKRPVDDHTTKYYLKIKYSIVYTM